MHVAGGVSSNVYIPAQIADPSLIMQGDVVEVRAHWNARNSNWRAFGECLRDGKAIPPREFNTAAFQGGESPAAAKPAVGGGGGGGGGGGASAAGGQAGGGANKTGWMVNYKTRICKNWQQGNCQYGAKCTFAHGACFSLPSACHLPHPVLLPPLHPPHFLPAEVQSLRNPSVDEALVRCCLSRTGENELGGQPGGGGGGGGAGRGAGGPPPMAGGMGGMQMMGGMGPPPGGGGQFGGGPQQQPSGAPPSNPYW